MHDSPYRLQLHMGGQSISDNQIMTPKAFQSHIAWPRVRPFQPEEAAAHGNQGGEGHGEQDDDEESEEKEGTSNDNLISEEDDDMEEEEE